MGRAGVGSLAGSGPGSQIADLLHQAHSPFPRGTDPASLPCKEVGLSGFPTALDNWGTGVRPLDKSFLKYQQKGLPRWMMLSLLLEN